MGNANVEAHSIWLFFLQRLALTSFTFEIRNCFKEYFTQTGIAYNDVYKPHIQAHPNTDLPK